MDQSEGPVEIVTLPKVALVGLIATLIRNLLPAPGDAELAATKMIDRLSASTAELIAQQELATRRPQRWLPHVVAGQDLPDEHRPVLEAYWREHGRPQTGTILTAAMVNIIVDWWNARDNVPTTPDVPPED